MGVRRGSHFSSQSSLNSILGRGFYCIASEPVSVQSLYQYSTPNLQDNHFCLFYFSSQFLQFSACSNLYQHCGTQVLRVRNQRKKTTYGMESNHSQPEKNNHVLVQEGENHVKLWSAYVEIPDSHLHKAVQPLYTKFFFNKHSFMLLVWISLHDADRV